MKRTSILWRSAVVILLLLSSCNLPFSKPGGTPLPDPESLPLMPPAVIETVPPVGSEIPLQSPITFYFNQPMDQSTVETAMTISPQVAGSLSWDGDSIAIFTPLEVLPAGAELIFNLATSALSTSGQAAASAQTISFRTAQALSVLQTLPRADSLEVVATSAVVASFNQSVVALGADASALPAGFTLEPQAAGRGEWLNTSTYIFYPEPALEGGVTYTVRVNADLVAVSGGRLSSPTSWSFTVANPRLLTLEPSSELALALDAELILTFNQPMDTASVESAFSLNGPGGPVAGAITWDEHETLMTFTPASLLARDTNYSLVLSSQAKGRGGTPIDRSSTVYLRSYPNFYLNYSSPGEGEIMNSYNSPEFIFSAPPEEFAEDLITIRPDAGTIYTWQEGTILHVNADFLPQTEYTLTISSALKDIWGQSLGEDVVLHFETSPATPSLSFPYIGGDAYYVRSGRPEFYVQALNIPYVDIQLGSVSVEDFLSLNSPGNWEARNYYQPGDALTWRQYIQGTANVNAPVKLQIPENGGALDTGIYFLRAYSGSVDYNPSPDFLIASGVNLTLKMGTRDALVWAVDLRTNQPVAGADVRLYSYEGGLIASGVTDAQGIWQGEVNINDPYETIYAVLDEPGETTFSLVASDWDQDISAWDFGLSNDMSGPENDLYMYTDRPIYRPGQTVYFRTVLRQHFDGEFSASPISSLSLVVRNDTGNSWNFDLPLSSYGTAQGELALPADASPGTYYFSSETEAVSTYFSFTVAEYVKPEIDLAVEITPGEAESGTSLQANVNARYFFDAPSGSLPVEWTLYAQSGYFYLPDYQVGAFTDRWLNPGRDDYYYDTFGETLLSGEGVTGPDGTLTIEIAAADLPGIENLTTLTLEVTAQDESGQPVSARATAKLHPADFYIGIRPDVWVGQAGTAINFDVLAVDWNGEADGVHPLHTSFSSVTWERTERVTSYGDHNYTFTPVYTEISKADFATGADGRSRIQFTPPGSGTYLLDVSGGGAHSQALIWVGGSSQAIWPNLPHDQLSLTADRDSYQVGDTAEVFIPNPLGGQTLALVSMERGTIRSTQVLTLGASGSVLSFPLAEGDAPNIYISATLVGSGAFLQGFINLEVEDPGRVLNVELTSTPERAGPREPVTFTLHVSDSQGRPVQGEFSLAVVDLAALALADPNSVEIVPYYTRLESLGIDTSISLAADSKRGVFLVGGMGGGGGGGFITVRQDFPDTAYWNGQIVTDANGNASVSMTLPDSLTTWQVDVRGLTTDTRIGQAQSEIITTRELLVRPVTPLFLVAGDHVQVGAVIHNNTDHKLVVKATLQAVNFNLDKDPKTTQKVTVPAGGRVLVNWWGTAQEAETAELTFSVQSGSLNDASTPARGALPILRYTTPQTYTTAGILTAAGSKLEAVSLPRSFDPGSGSLTVELSPSLAADLLSGLDAIEEPPSTASNEYLASYLLPNLAVYRALQDAGLEDTELTERSRTTLQSVLMRLAYHQNYNDGGWAWYTTASYPWEYEQAESDPYLSAYILFGLQQAKDAGFEVEEDTVVKAREFLVTTLQNRRHVDGELDQWALINFVLQETGGADMNALNRLSNDKELLQPWAQALLAVTLESAYPGSEEAAQILSNLDGTAIRSASGASWESASGGWMNPSTTLLTTAMVTYALARQDPAAPLLSEAVRWLSNHRSADGMWGSTYESAWIILALNTYMVGTGGYAANYSFGATFNNQPIASGLASGPTSLTPVISTVPIASLLADYPNALSIQRGEGTGNLYYRAALQVYQPVETVLPLEKGIGIERSVVLDGCDQDCPSIRSVPLSEGTRLVVSLTLTLPHDAYYLMVEDAIPAGTQILNTDLKTSQQGEGSGTSFEVYDPENPYMNGWGWWYFSSPQIHDESIAWSVDYLPAGTYVLTYTLIPMQAGEFHVMPARAWLSFFPEVQGRSAGSLFTITP